MKFKDIITNRMVIVGIFIGLAIVNIIFATVAFTKTDGLTGIAFSLFSANLLAGAFRYLVKEQQFRDVLDALDNLYDFVEKTFNKRKPNIEVHEIGISEEQAKELSALMENIRKNAVGHSVCEQPADEQPNDEKKDPNPPSFEEAQGEHQGEQAGEGDGC